MKAGIDRGTLKVLRAVDRKSTVAAKRQADADFVLFEIDRNKSLVSLPFLNSDISGKHAYTAFSKYDHPEPELSEQQLASVNLAASWMTCEFGPQIGLTEVMSEADVIASTDGSRSPGFPWNNLYPTCNEFYVGAHSDEPAKLWDRAAAGRQMVIWNSFLKEELRAEHKVLSGDTRQINGCPVDFKVCMNRYCLDFNNKFYNAQLKTPSAVGMDVFHGGWDALYRKLSVHPTGYCADVQRWDSHFPRVLFERIKRFRWECLAPNCQEDVVAHYKRFDNLYENIIESATVMPWGEVVQTKLGNPSGSPNTVVDNTLGLYMLFCYSYIEKCKESGVHPAKAEFDEHVCAVLYGDDNTFSVSEDPPVPFGVSDVVRFADDLGYLVTTDTEEP